MIKKLIKILKGPTKENKIFYLKYNWHNSISVRLPKPMNEIKVGTNKTIRHVFVFGSNERGAHIGGAAKFAALHYGAEEGWAEGLCGNSYAIPTVNKYGMPLPLSKIKEYVDNFVVFARKNKKYGMIFHVTPVGCGIAGHNGEDIGCMFAKVGKNVILPLEFSNGILKANGIKNVN